MLTILGGHGFDGNERASESALLHNSVKNNEQHLVTATIERGANVNWLCAEDPIDVRTPLRAACTQANVRVIRMLLEQGAQVHAHFETDRWTALHSAAHAGHEHIVRLLLVEVEELHENHWHDGFSLLHILSECLNSRLLNSGADLFVWALRHMPNMTIEAKSSRLGYSDWTPLHIACARGWSKAAMLLLRSHAEVASRTGEFHVRSPRVNEFARDGAQVASVEPNFQQVANNWLDSGLLPIHLAAFGGHLSTLRMLVKSGQSINAKSHRHNWTPLMFAVWSGNVHLVSEICRTGGRSMINCKDRRADGSEWTPLAIAVSRWGPDMVQALISFGADPLIRLGSANFPGQAFLSHVAPLLLDGQDNLWSGPDSRISLLHLAVVRGNVRVLNNILEFMRAAHFNPARGRRFQKLIPDQEVAPNDRAVPPGDRRPRPAPLGSPAGSASGGQEERTTQAIVQVLNRSPTAQERAHERSLNAPVSESQDYDPISFCTAEGWSPAVLAVLLHTVDPMGQVPSELLEAFPQTSKPENTRADVFVGLLSTGKSLLEDKPEASPPVMPQRFHDVSETLVCRVVDEFVRLCKASGSERVAYRISHATLCVACRFNRLQVVKHLLDSGLCDPRCRFLKPVECRPLHIATACGFGYMAQMLLEHKADPLEGDENSEQPIFKLARYYDRQFSEMQAQMAELENQLAEARGPKQTLGMISDSYDAGYGGNPQGPSPMSPRALPGSPKLSKRFDLRTTITM